MARGNYPNNKITPYLSVVATSRNDNYGGNVIGKMQVFVDCLCDLAEKYSLPSELIIVDWNPPVGKPRLKEEVVISRILRYTTVRFIEVPHELHAQLPNAEKIYLYEYVAKNVGVRRARGEFILVTNPDNFFSEPLFKEFAKQRLRENCFYRIGRLNLRYDIPPTLTTYDERYRFARANKNVESFRTRFAGYPNVFLKRFIPLRFLKSVVKDYLIPFFTHYPFQPPILCTPGDFILMHRDRWFVLRGFEQISSLTGKTYSGSDAIMVYKALSSGLKQKYLFSFFKDLRIYSMPQDNDKFTIAGPSYLDEYYALFKKMIQERKPVNGNDEDWGFGNVALKEEAAYSA